MTSKFTIESLEMVISGINAGIWDWDLSTDQQIWSDHFYELLGFAPEEILSNHETFTDFLVHPDDREIVVKAIKKQLESLIPYKVQVRLRTKHNGFKFFECAGNVKVVDGKPVRIVGCISDIHDQITLKEDLIKKENLLKEAGRLAKIGTWELDLVSNMAIWSKEVFDIHELDEGAQPDLFNALEYFKPWARPVMTNAVEKACADGSMWDLELPIESAKGNDLWVRSIGKAVMENGKVVRLYGVLQDLTASKQIEEKFSVIFQYSTDAHLLLDENGIIDCNHAAVSMLKCKDKRELLSFHPAAFSPEFQPDGQTSDEKSKEMDRLAYQNGYHQFEWIHKRIDGEEFPVEVTLKPVQFSNKEVLLVVWHDITKRKLSEEIIIRNEAMLAETQQLTHSGSWEMDLLTGQNYWSDETFRIFGLEPSRNGMDTMKFEKMVHSADLDIFNENLNLTKTKLTPSKFDLRIVLPDGKIKFIHVISKPLTDLSGKVIKLYGAIMDVDDRKKSEKELIMAKEQAETAAIAKSQFLSTMSHEIRTPMNAVIGFTHLLLQQDPKPQQMEYLNILKYSAENLLVLINDILDFSKIEAGKIEFEEVDFNVLTLMENIRFGIVQMAEEKGILLKLMVDSDLNVAVVGDPVRLGQILTNLISNAVKFTKNGRVVISASLVKQDKDHKTIEFKIEDTGIGIAPDKVDHIFDRFTQASSDTTRKYGGSGLGLAITKRLLELQNSTIHVKSELGKGSVFYFNLDFKMSHKQLSRELVRAVPNYLSLKGTKVLMAEDNVMNVILMKNFLKQWDVECDVAENGQIAYEMVQANHYDMVFMDLQMPEMDGYQATAKIRMLPGQEFKDLPIIALTASAMLDIKDTAFAIGMNDYVSKPFNPRELHSKIAMFKSNKKEVGWDKV